MVRGQYIAGTGMLLQRRMMETITNNITNADTTGYKKEHLVSHSFDDVLLERINDQSVVGRTRLAGPLNFGTQIDQLYVNYEMGNLEPTGRSTDLALAGDAFFTLETAAGERYSRSGAFVVSREGYLVDGEGNYLLGENGRVYVGGTDFTIDETGRVIIDGQITNRLRTVSFADNASLRKQGGNLYFALEEPEAATKGHAVLQGFLENSNVDIGREMVDMITVYRTYETNQRMLTMIDETVGKAVNEIGRLR